MRYSSLALVAIAVCCATVALAQGQNQEQEEVPNSGSSLYEIRCASCHRDLTGANDRIPTEAQLRERSPEQVVAALTSGAMTAQATGLSDEEIEAIVERRREARKAKDFAAADAARNELLEAGIDLKDSPDGTTTWTLRRGRDG